MGLSRFWEKHREVLVVAALLGALGYGILKGAEHWSDAQEDTRHPIIREAAYGHGLSSGIATRLQGKALTKEALEEKLKEGMGKVPLLQGLSSEDPVKGEYIDIFMGAFQEGYDSVGKRVPQR